MHEHDYEIIMALAEGTLDGAAAEEAAAEISACAECSADLEMQRAALASLAEAPAVYMTASESATLRDNLKRELGVATAEAAPPRRSFAWGRWIPAVGIAAAFVFMLAIIPGIFGGSSDDSADDTVAALETLAPERAGGAVTETTAAASAEMAPQEEQLMMADDAAEADGADMAAAETTEAPAATTTTAADSLSTDLALNGLIADLGPLDELDTEQLLDQLAVDEERSGFEEASEAVKSADPFFAACLTDFTLSEEADQAGIPAGSEPLIVGTVTTDAGDELVVVAYLSDTTDTVLAVHRLSDCTLAELLP